MNLHHSLHILMMMFCLEKTGIIGDLDVKTRCIITVAALIASGMINTSLVHHFENAKAHGVTQKEIAAVITHIAFYAGWPKGWAAFNLAKKMSGV